MQIIEHWPGRLRLAIPDTVKEALLSHLSEPFGDEEATQEFWQQYPSTIIIFDEVDTSDSLEFLSEGTQAVVTLALKCPEYSDSLSSQYSISLTITSDEGQGLYLVIDNRSTLLNQS